MKKEFLSFNVKTCTKYSRPFADVNELTGYTPMDSDIAHHYNNNNFYDVDGNIIDPSEDFFPIANEPGTPGPGIDGFPELKNDAKVCSIDYTNHLEDARKLAYHGRWTPGARRRFKKCCHILFRGAVTTWEKHPSKTTRFPFQIAFLTLTIPQGAGYISPKKAHKTLLEPFLRWMRRKFKINGYVWVREFQKNGMIHYHLVYDKFILKTELRRYWNALMKNAGYLKEFFKKHPGKEPPSTHVNKAQNPDQCTYYMEKYMSKALKDNDQVGEGEEEDGVDRSGKLWDASLNLKQGKPFRTEVTPEIINHLEKLVESKVIDKKVEAYVTIYFAKKGDLLDRMPRKIIDESSVHYRRILYAGTDLEPPPV